MAEGGLYDLQFMIVSKKRIERKVLLSDPLKNASTLINWIVHEKQIVEIVSPIRKMENDEENLKTKNPILWTDLGNFFI